MEDKLLKVEQVLLLENLTYLAEIYREGEKE